MKKCVVIFLDLLGFKSFTNDDSSAALRMLEDFNSVLSLRRQIASMKPLPNLPKELANPLPERTSLDSFKYFIPMSDSVFILSDEPNKLAVQLSTFLLDSFGISGWAFGKSVTSDVHEQCGKELRINRWGKPEVHRFRESWYPVLFRGGISYSEATADKNSAVYDGEEITVPNVIGPGVVRAVQLEQGGLKGPRILCDGEFVDELTCQTKRYLRQVGDEWELLWPAFGYIESNGEGNHIDVFNELFFPAHNLYECYVGKPSENHYRAFLELIVRSHLAFVRTASIPEPVYEYLYEKLNEAGLRLSGTDLNAELVFPDANAAEQEQ